MWKGYRDAQLAFFQCTQPKNPHAKKQKQNEQSVYQYLAIYAPRRGLLEIWKVRNGSRQAVFSVGEDSLLVNDSSCFGLDSMCYGTQTIEGSGAALMGYGPPESLRNRGRYAGAG